MSKRRALFWAFARKVSPEGRGYAMHGRWRLGLFFALMALLVMALSPHSVFADGPADTETAGLTLGLGGAIAGTVAIVKAAVPALSSRQVPLVVLGVSLAFVLVAAFSTGQHDLLAILLTTVSQTIAAMGWREGLTAVVPAVSELPARGGAAPLGAPPNA